MPSAEHLLLNDVEGGEAEEGENFEIPCDSPPVDAAADDSLVVEDYPLEHHAAAVMLSAMWRGFSARKEYEEKIVTRQWAAVKVQSFFRARKARTVFAKRMRYVFGLVRQSLSSHACTCPRMMCVTSYAIEELVIDVAVRRVQSTDTVPHVR